MGTQYGSEGSAPGGRAHPQPSGHRDSPLARMLLPMGRGGKSDVLDASGESF